MAMILTPLPRATTTLGTGERPIDEALALVDVAAIAKLIRQIGQDRAQDLALAPLPKATMHRLVVGMALRQHVPLRARVQNPQHCFEHLPRRHRLTTGTAFRNRFLRKTLPDA